MGKKALSTQTLVNVFPDWADIRTDEQSLGFQLMNVIGATFDDMRSQVTKAGVNRFLNTAVVGDIGVTYRHDLPGNFVFEREDDDDTELFWIAPTVSGVKGDNVYTVTLASGNTVEQFWYHTPPTRIEIGTSVSGEWVLASGFVQGSPFAPLTLSGLCHNPNRLAVTMSGGTSYLDIEDDNTVRRGRVHIRGVTREGLDATEELFFLHDETQYTRHEYTSISDGDRAVSVYGMKEVDQAHIIVRSARFQDPEYRSAWDLSVTEGKNFNPLFWGLGSGLWTHEQYSLDLRQYDAEDIELRLDGFTSKHTVMQQELVNWSGHSVKPLDLAVEPYSDNIWVVDSGVLYLYDAGLPYPDMSLLDGKDYDSESVLEPSSYSIMKGDELELLYIWRRPIRSIERHRAWVIRPDTNTYSLVDGEMVDYDTTEATSWVFGEPLNRMIRPAEFYYPDQEGFWVFCLEVEYADGEREIDKRVVNVVIKRPVTQFNLLDAGLTNHIVGIDIDSDNKIWVLDTVGGIHEVVRHYDTMIADFDRKVLYFREPYDKVKVY